MRPHGTQNLVEAAEKSPHNEATNIRPTKFLLTPMFMRCPYRFCILCKYGRDPIGDAVTGITSDRDALWAGVLSYAWAWGH